MDDGSDRVISRFQKKETRSSASLWFVATVGLMVLLGAGCAKAVAPESVVKVQPEQKVTVETYDLSSYATSALTDNCFIPYKEFYGVLYQDKQVSFGKDFPVVSNNFKQATKGGEFEVLCYDPNYQAVYFSMATTSAEYLYPFPSSNYGGNGHVFGFWKPQGPGSQGDRVVFSPALSGRSSQELTSLNDIKLTWDAEGSAWKIAGHTEGSVQTEEPTRDWSAELAFYPATQRLELVSSTNTDEIDAQLADELGSLRVSDDCLKSQGEALLSESLETYLKVGLKVPQPSPAFETAISGKRLQTVCYDKKNNLVYFTELAYYFTELDSQNKPGPKVELRLPKNAEKGTTYRFGYWDTKFDKVKFSPYFSANGVGDMAVIEKVQLAKEGSISISGETGGGDGPCGWNSKVVYDAAKNSIKAEKYNEYCDGP